METKKFISVGLALSLLFSTGVVLAEQDVETEKLTKLEDAFLKAEEIDTNVLKAKLDRDLAKKKLEDARDLQDSSVNEILASQGVTIPLPDAVVNAKIGKELSFALAENGVFLADKSIEHSELGLKKNVEEAYIAYLEAKESVEIANKNLSQAKENFNIINKQFDLGMITKSDQLKAESTLAQVELGVEKSNSDLIIASQTLNQLIDQPLRNEIYITDEMTLTEPDSELMTLENLVELAKENRPDYLAQVKRIETEKLKLDIYQSVYLNKNNPTVFEQNINVQKEELNLIQAERNLVLQVSNILQSVKLAQKQMISAQKNLESAEEMHRIAELRFQNGLDTELSLISSQVSLLQQNLSYVQSKYNLIKLYRNVSYLIGTEI